MNFTFWQKLFNARGLKAIYLFKSRNEVTLVQKVVGRNQWHTQDFSPKGVQNLRGPEPRHAVSRRWCLVRDLAP